MIDGVTGLCELPALPGRVAPLAGDAIFHVNVLRWGNPPSRGCVHVAFTGAPKTSPRDPGVLRLYVNAGYFSTTAKRVT